jgi:hypothetical protein
MFLDLKLGKYELLRRARTLITLSVVDDFADGLDGAQCRKEKSYLRQAPEWKVSRSVGLLVRPRLGILFEAP